MVRRAFWVGVGWVMGALTAYPVHALDLKVRPWPMSDRVYESIDVNSVRAEIYLPETAWLERVGGKNGSLSLELNLLPVASIDIYRLYTEEEISHPEQLIEEARKTAAKFGANVIFLERRLMQGRELDGLRFTAYRAEYKHRLLNPTFLAALPHMTVAPSLLEEQLLAWNMSHFGTKKIAVAKIGTLKTGTAIRVVMRDGTDVKGAFNGIDADNQIWIHPAGWTGLFRDKAISPSNVQSVSLLN